MKNVYRITFDIRVGRTWLGANNPNGWNSRHVLANGDARAACQKLEREEKRFTYEGQRASAVRIIRVDRVAEDVLV